MIDSAGSAAQVRLIGEQIAEAVITKYVAEHPPQAEIPATLKWAGAIAAAVFAACTIGLVVWLVSSVSQMQVTLARMDERMSSGSVKDSRYEEVERRVSTLEKFHQGGGK